MYKSDTRIVFVKVLTTPDSLRKKLTKYSLWSSLRIKITSYRLVIGLYIHSYAQIKGVIGLQPKIKYPRYSIIFPKVLHCNYTDLLKMSNILSSEFNANI